nr:hypothetical protein [Tanacetum cinerariifolium]
KRRGKGVFCDGEAGIVAFLIKDERKESIQEGLDLLVVLANTRPDLLMDDDLYESERGEQSNDDDLGVGFWQQLFVQGDAVNEKELQAYDIGRDGLVCVARVYGEVGMLALTEMSYSFRIWVSHFLGATPSSDGDI